ncbi:MAG: septum formation initiator family protein [Saprospiraceae bacterium]|nr:septum formation initiator family protein [Saprospiraceae bacterium]
MGSKMRLSGATLLRRLSQVFLDKYLLAGAIFVVWVGFFDRNSMMTQLALSKTISELESEKAYLLDQIEETNNKKSNVVRNQEKFAREKFYMKKPGEQVYILEQ